MLEIWNLEHIGNLEIWKSRNLESQESEIIISIMLEIWESKRSKQYGFKLLDMGNGPRCLGGNYGTAKEWDMKKCGANKKLDMEKKTVHGQDLAQDPVKDQVQGLVQDLEPDIVFNDDHGIWSEMGADDLKWADSKKGGSHMAQEHF